MGEEAKRGKSDCFELFLELILSAITGKAFPHVKSKRE